MAVADDGEDAGEGGQFLWGALGVTAGGEDAGVGIEAVGAADKGAGFAVGFGGDAAGDHDHIGFGGVAVDNPAERRRPAMASPSARAARQPKFSMWKEDGMD